MTVLVLDILHSKSLKSFGRVEIQDIVELDGTNPIDKYVAAIMLQKRDEKNNKTRKTTRQEKQ